MRVFHWIATHIINIAYVDGPTTDEHDLEMML